MYYLVATLYVLVCLALMLVVLLQQGKGGDIASAFGGGSSQAAFGARSGATVLSRATTICAVLFMVGALALVHPSRRAVFERIYAEIAADLPIEAEFMRSFRVDLVREDRAIVVIESEVPVEGSLVREDFPMLLVRGRGGQWMVLEY